MLLDNELYIFCKYFYCTCNNNINEKYRNLLGAHLRRPQLHSSSLKTQFRCERKYSPKKNVHPHSVRPSHGIRNKSPLFVRNI